MTARGSVSSGSSVTPAARSTDRTVTTTPPDSEDHSAADQRFSPAVPLLLTVESAAQQLGIGRTAMYALVKSGDVESIRIGHLRRIPIDALHTFIASLRIRKDDAAA